MDGRNWYDINSNRRYPLDDAASAEGQGGELPQEFLADLRVSFPNHLGSRARLGSARSSPHLATFTIVSDQGHPLAAYTVAKSKAVYSRAHNLTPLSPGVSGYVVLGQPVEDFEIAFETVESSVLHPRTVTVYRTPTVHSLGKYGAHAFHGIVELQSSDEVEILIDEREVGNEVKDCVVIRLQGQGGQNGNKYRGRCTGRPESRTCNPASVETVNGVEPNVHGILEIELQPDGLWDVYPTQGGYVGVLDADIGFGDLCSRGNLPDNDGRFSYEEDGACGVPATPQTDPDPPPVPAEVSFSGDGSKVTVFHGGIYQDNEAGYAVVTHPSRLGGPVLVNGEWTATPSQVMSAMLYAEPGYNNIHPVQRADGSAFGRRASVVVGFPDLPNVEGTPQGGLIFGWRHASSGMVFFQAGLTRTGVLSVQYWTGNQFVPMLSTPLGNPSNPQGWTELAVQFTPTPNFNYAFSLTASSVDSGLNGGLSFSTPVIQYAMGDGYGCWGTKDVRLDTLTVGGD